MRRASADAVVNEGEPLTLPRTRNRLDHAWHLHTLIVHDLTHLLVGEIILARAARRWWTAALGTRRHRRLHGRCRPMPVVPFSVISSKRSTRRVVTMAKACATKLDDRQLSTHSWKRSDGRPFCEVLADRTRTGKRPSRSHPGALMMPKLVGYWDAPWCARLELPRPDGLIRAGWRPCERDKISEYLRHGMPIAKFCGFASCRLCDEVLGTKDLTDGEWVWPERLEHYITDHDVILPDAFIATMERNDWRAPARPDVTAASSSNRPSHLPYRYESFDDWRQWAAKQSLLPAEPAEIVDQAAKGREDESTMNASWSLMNVSWSLMNVGWSLLRRLIIGW